jgi:hypothetical protein
MKQLKRREEQMRRTLEKLKQEVDEKRAQFASEKQSWEQLNGVTFDELRRRSLEGYGKE